MFLQIAILQNAVLINIFGILASNFIGLLYFLYIAILQTAALSNILYIGINFHWTVDF